LRNARGPDGFIATTLGGLVAPESVITSGIGVGAANRVFQGARAARNARIAALLAKQGVTGARVTTTAGRFSMFGENLLGGVAARGVQEAGLHALDPMRTGEETMSNFATGAILDSILG